MSNSIQSESLNKYLAGLLDTDGCGSFRWKKLANGRWHLQLAITLTTSLAVNPKKDLLPFLRDHYGVGHVLEHPPKDHSGYLSWTISSRGDLFRFLPHVLKHMLIKARHWQGMWGEYLLHKEYTDAEMEALKEASKVSRTELVGPLKPKNYIGPAYTAGVMDGDGCYTNRHYASTSSTHIRATVKLHGNDRILCDMLQKTWGGRLHNGPASQPHLIIWTKNLGFSASTGALQFLGEMVKHSRLKKHKIEMMIHTHRQRLSENTPTGEAIV